MPDEFTEATEQPSDVVASSVPTSAPSDSDLSNLQEIQIRGFGDLGLLFRNLMDEQRSILRELTEQKAEGQRLNKELVERNQQLQSQLELVTRVREEQENKPGEKLAEKIKGPKRPFSPFGF